MITFKHVLVSTDFSAPAAHAVAVAVDLAKEYGAALTLVHAWDLPVYADADGIAIVDMLGPLEDSARASLDEALAAVKKEVPEAKAILRRGIAWREILQAIDETKADLVVVGTHGRQGIPRVLLGSVAEKVVRHSPVPVLVAREPERKAAA